MPGACLPVLAFGVGVCGCGCVGLGRFPVSLRVDQHLDEFGDYL
jgi:hypothetical protein